ncbi:hypothetical protein [Haloprofundus halobius]|uniref:hypothetical protein n=1 Tax=Haloprofundus halobius TaxID=2876194 RepID=UPI001CCD3453|nr:hypothetical protein [Haloprofundus halobius]
MRLGDPTLVWGVMLSPFWFLPGPSALYARVGIAFLGAAAVYNVVLLGIQLHSRRAGIVAGVPLAVLPSLVLVHASLLREAVVLFALTSVVRLWLAPPRRLRQTVRVALAVALLLVATALRIENVPFYALVVGVGIVATLLERERVPYPSLAVPAVGIVGGLVAASQLPRVTRYLTEIRDARARGRAVYLADALPANGLELIAFSWVAAAYFLFAPFPWMVSTPADLVGMAEGLVTLGFAVASIWGVRSAGRVAPAATVTLLVGLLVGATLYGLANANYGTTIRQRQMFTWVLYLFGGIGVCEHFRIRW